MPYNPSLDVLRVAAVFLVMAFHARLPGFIGGWLGVDLFFVLSGFLITRLLLREHQASGCINLPRFWLRRFRRLTPPLFLMLGVYVLAAPTLWPDYPHAARDAVFAATYVSNYTTGFGEWPAHLSHMWSLAVEEQYYLIWPLALLGILAAPRRAVWIFPLSFLVAFAIRDWSAQSMSWEQTYYVLHTRLTGLILGSAAGYFYRPINFSPVLLMALGACMLAIGVQDAVWHHARGLKGPMAFAEFGSLMMILACAARPDILKFTRLAWLGKYTYGMYLWHYPVMVYLRPGDPFEIMAIGSVVSTVLAIISYHTVEALFRRRPSERFERADGIEAPGGQDVERLGRDPIR